MTDGLAISSHANDKRFFSPPLIPRTFALPTLESAQLTKPSLNNKLFTYSSRSSTDDISGS
uniref:ABC transporter G family member 7 isoform X1 n=1 Tax=Rhizophora mucronata TaxID=61149 RepID=A0A2P2M5V2_RHIMU